MSPSSCTLAFYSHPSAGQMLCPLIKASSVFPWGLVCCSQAAGVTTEPYLAFCHHTFHMAPPSICPWWLRQCLSHPVSIVRNLIFCTHWALGSSGPDMFPEHVTLGTRLSRVLWLRTVTLDQKSCGGNLTPSWLVREGTSQLGEPSSQGDPWISFVSVSCFLFSCEGAILAGGLKVSATGRIFFCFNYHFVSMSVCW